MSAWSKVLTEQLNEESNNKKINQVIEDFLLIISPHIKTLSDKASHNKITLLAKQLSDFKSKIVKVNKESLEENFIPKIAEELHLIVKHTEVSVDKILDIFDEISGIILKINNTPIKEELISKSAQILEVCNFQDNVGQRINIIVDSLSDIERTISTMLQSTNQEPIKTKTKPARPDEHLLNGPDKNAPSQQEIDDLFGKL